jgi:Fur family peroxide stress response transcriptional regulator
MQKPQKQELNERLATSGLRFTAQRQHVYDVLLQTRDHPTAEEVFIRAKQTSPDISIATVYNCLDALVKCNLVRQVNVDRGATRFCPNMKDHCHFCCDECGGVFDIDSKYLNGIDQIHLPKGFKLARREISLKGFCPECASQK